MTKNKINPPKSLPSIFKKLETQNQQLILDKNTLKKLKGGFIGTVDIRIG